MARRFLLKTVSMGALTVALCGCETVFDLVGVAQPLTASQAHRFDGSYQGDIDLVSATAKTCPAGEGERVVMVGDGVLWYAYSPVTLFTLPVAYDGVIDGRSGNVTMKGKIDGNYLTAVIKSPNCETSLSMKYIYNHS